MVATEIEVHESPANGRQLVSTVAPALAEIFPPAPQAKLRKLLLVGASVLALAGGANLAWDYWTVGRFST